MWTTSLVFLTMTDYICTRIHIHSALKAMIHMTYNISIYTFKVYSLMEFSITVQSSPQSILEHVCLPQKKLCILQLSIPMYPQYLQLLVSTTILPVCTDLPILDITYEWMPYNTCLASVRDCF